MMANKADKFYFENFMEAGRCSQRAAESLAEYLKSYDVAEMEAYLVRIHEIEHDGDSKRHAMSAALAKAFVTPVDREDLALISSNIDNVTDSIEEVAQRLYVDRIKSILPEAILFADKLVECCRLMTEMLGEFENFKKPAKLREMIIELSNKEEACDELYLKSLLAIYDHCTDPLEIIFWREIFEHLEKCADACEHVGDVVETVVMKNS